MSAVRWHLACVDCAATYGGMDVRYRCDCGGTLDVVHERDALDVPSLETFDQRRASRAVEDRSGVWRFRELVLPLGPAEIVSKPEGNTNLYCSARLSAWTGCENLALKHEGENPTGSFKDRGMTAGVSIARALGMTRVACASTGNTSASMASYAAQAGMRAFVFIPQGKVAFGKLSQTLAYGARTIQIEGDFDAAMKLVERVCAERGVYLLNSVNPFRIEGQKAIAFELLQDLGWRVPDWLVLPGGNLGNTSAIAKGLAELHVLGRIPRLPRIAVIQARGANPFARAWREQRDLVPLPDADTIATAIRIGAPVSWKKALRGVTASNGVVDDVTDAEILEAKAEVDAAGIGAEPASCATVAGLRKLVAAGVIARDARVAGILTGHLMKDPETVVRFHSGEIDSARADQRNAPVQAKATIEGVLAAME